MESRAQRTFRRIGAFAKIGAVAGIAGVGIAARKAFSEFEEAEKATRQTDAVLKSTGNVAGVTAKEIENLANAISLKSGKDDEAVQSAENLLLTFTSVRNEVGKGNDIFSQATTVIADMSAALGQDFKASTIQVGKALQDPIKGITALRRVGVNFNATQTETVKKMVESGNLMGAQKFILRELRTEFEGSAAAQATSADKLRVAIDNLLEAFGKTFGPALEKAFQGLAGFVTQMQTGEGAGGKFGGVVKGVGKAISGAFSGISSLASGAVEAIDNLIGRFGDLRTEGKSVPATLGTILGQAISSIDLGAIADKIGQGLEKGLDFGDDFAASVTEGIQTAFSEIDGEKLLGGLVEVVAQAINALFSPKFWIDHFGAILATVTIFIPVGKLFKLPGFSHLYRFISAPFFRAVSAVGKGIAGLFGKAGAGALDAFVIELARIAPRSVNAMNAVLNAVRRTLSGLPGVVKGVLGRFAGALANAFTSAGERAGRALAKALSAILGPIARIARDIGGAIIGPIVRQVGRFAGVFRPFEKALRSVRSVAEGSFAGIRSAIEFVISKVRALIGLAKKIKFPDINPFAQGGIVKSQVALVGEEGPELAKLPTGKMGLVGAAGPEIRSLPTGTRVFSHPETKRKLAPLTQRVIQRLVPASIRQPEPLSQRVTQESLGTDQGRQSPRATLSKALGARSQSHFVAMARKLGIPGFARGGVVPRKKDDEEERDPTARRGQSQESTESGKRREAGISQRPDATSRGRAILARAEKLDRLQLPYVWGGGHGNVAQALKKGFDCSGAVSYVLGISPRVSGQLAGYGASGKGPVSVFANAKHTFMSIFGRGFGTSPENPGKGPGWLSYNDRSGFEISHLAGVTPEEGDKTGKKAGPRRFRKLSLGQYVTVAKKVGFPDPALAAAIFYAESKGNVRAVGDNGESFGGAQIHWPDHQRYDKDKLRDDIFYNFRAALAISKHGKTFQPWTQYRTGAYKQFLRGRAQPLPKGTSKGTPTGSSYADFLTMKQTDSLDTLSSADDLKWINRALRYWRGVYRRNKRAGNWQRAGEAKGNVQDLKGKRKELRDAKEEIAEDAFTLGDLIHIGKPPKALDISWMNRFVFEPLELKRAQAALTTPPDDDPSQAAIATSLQDDIGAAGELKTWWERLYKMTTGFRLPAQYPDRPFNPTSKQQKYINAVPTQAERIERYNQLAEEHRLGPWVIGTIKQQIDAATNLASAKSDLKNLTDEAGRTEAAEESVAGPTKSEDIKSFLSQISELFKQYGRNFQPLPSFAKGGTMKRPGFALVGEEGPEIIKLPAGANVIPPKNVEMTGGGQVINKNVTQNNYFPTPPPDSHVWTHTSLRQAEQAI